MIDIDQVSAGPEMDRLLAEHVMEWTLSDRGFYVTKPGTTEPYYTPDNFKPSTDKNTMWLLIDKLLPQTERFYLSSVCEWEWRKESDWLGYECYFIENGLVATHGRGPGGPELAVCRSAYRTAEYCRNNDSC